jgi:Mn2+/Fe2+ NRAMP family transporter
MVKESNSRIQQPPAGKERIKWLGPGFLWMVSAAGSGELLFSPRVGALYGYALLWALIAAVLFKWFINREIGRYTVCTGATVIDGFSKLPGPKNWALYFILIPQLFVAVSTIAGLAGSAGTALIVALPGDIRIWTIGSIFVSTALVIWGHFKAVELVATILAVLLSLAAIAAAITVFPDFGALIQGLLPQIPGNIEYGEILPWLGFMLSGAAGMIWYSYWIQKKGYGAAGKEKGQGNQLTGKSSYSPEDKKRLKGWISQMTLDNNVAVFGTLIITIAFLILGTELLKPQGLVPEENKVAEILGQLLGQIWGPIGFWFMILGVFIGFWDTVLSDQDGFGRMFAGGSRLLLKHLKLSPKWTNEAFLKKFFVVIVVTLLPIALYLWIGEPVQLLKIAGVIEAAHIPVLAALILFLNHKKLPPELRPSLFTTILTAIAGLFFAVFAVIYLLQLVGIIKL